MSYTNLNGKSKPMAVWASSVDRFPPARLDELKLFRLQKTVIIVKFLVFGYTTKATDPLLNVRFTPPPANHPCGAIPETGCFILTVIGQWNDVYHWNYPALQYEVSHIHDNYKNDNATIAALQEMYRHFNACFLARPFLVNAAIIERIYPFLHIAEFGVIIGVHGPNSPDPDKITINDPTVSIARCVPKTAGRCITPSVGWLCVVFTEFDEYCSFLPIADLSPHTTFMKTRNPADLPDAEAFAFCAVAGRWKQEEIQKYLDLSTKSLRVESKDEEIRFQPKELNVYKYLETWNAAIRLYKMAEIALKNRVKNFFNEYTRLSAQEAVLHITSYIHQYQQQPQPWALTAAGFNGNNNNNNNTLFIVDPNLIATLSNTLYGEHFAEHLSKQFDDLKIMNHLQSHQHQQLSNAKLRYSRHHHGYIHNTPRRHNTLPSSSLTTSSLLAATTTTTPIDTLIQLATTIPASATTPSPIGYYDNGLGQQQQQQQSSQHAYSTLLQQYDMVVEQKNNLQMEYDDLVVSCEQIVKSKDDKIYQLEQQLAKMKEQYEGNAPLLKEEEEEKECHRHEDLVSSSLNDIINLVSSSLSYIINWTNTTTLVDTNTTTLVDTNTTTLVDTNTTTPVDTNNPTSPLSPSVSTEDTIDVICNKDQQKQYKQASNVATTTTIIKNQHQPEKPQYQQQLQQYQQQQKQNQQESFEANINLFLDRCLQDYKYHSKQKSELQLQQEYQLEFPPQQQKSTLQQQRSKLQQQKSQLQQQKSQLQQQKSQLQQQKSTLQQQKSTLQQQKSTLQQQRSTLQQQKSKLQPKYEDFIYELGIYINTRPTFIKVVLVVMLLYIAILSIFYGVLFDALIIKPFGALIEFIKPFFG